jgi:hypothetical protein
VILFTGSRFFLDNYPLPGKYLCAIPLTPSAAVTDRLIKLKKNSVRRHPPPLEVGHLHPLAIALRGVLLGRPIGRPPGLLNGGISRCDQGIKQRITRSEASEVPTAYYIGHSWSAWAWSPSPTALAQQT